MVYDAPSDRYVPIAWDDAFALIARAPEGARRPPNRAAFYTSGRASNEAAFLYQLFVRAFGTNNFPDCSNMCHEATSRGLPATVGVGKGTVTLDDFEHADTLLIFGQNPATNHPRMLGELREAAKRGATRSSRSTRSRSAAWSASPHPQSPLEMLTMGSTKISSRFVQPAIGGDFALLKGIAKRVLELDDAAVLAGRPRVLDHAFIAEHTAGFEAFADDLRAESWAALTAESGVSYEQIDSLAELYAKSERVIATWGMGITQHKHSVATIQMLSNLMLMRGNIGRPGAGLCPVRGHSNVQGDRTVGIEEKPTKAFLDRLGQVFDFEPPRQHGYDVVETIEAMLEGHVKVFIGLGGNFAMATPDTPRTWDGLRRLRADRAHHHQAQPQPPDPRPRRADPAHPRPHRDRPAERRPARRDGGGLDEHGARLLRHEQAGLAEPAVGDGDRRAHGDGPVRPARQRRLASLHRRLRAHPRRDRGGAADGFEDYNERIAQPGGFHLRVASRERDWNTPTGKANFVAHPLPTDTPIQRARALHGEKLLTLMTTRSHDQYNTTIYGLDDRYRGVFGQRRVVFANQDDLAMLGFEAGDWVDLETVWHDGIERRADGFLLVEYDIPRGCLGAYYPETNPLVPLDSTADIANTPTSKSIPVLMHRSVTAATRAAA